MPLSVRTSEVIVSPSSTYAVLLSRDVTAHRTVRNTTRRLPSLPTRTHAHVRACTHTHAHTCARAHTRARAGMRAHNHTHTHTHTPTHGIEVAVVVRIPAHVPHQLIDQHDLQHTRAHRKHIHACARAHSRTMPHARTHTRALTHTRAAQVRHCCSESADGLQRQSAALSELSCRRWVEH